MCLSLASFTQLIHPIAILLAVLTTTTLIVILLIFLLSTSWLSYVLFLVILGGLLILFIYVVSVTPNNIIKFAPAPLLLTLIILYLSWPTYAVDYSYNTPQDLVRITKPYFPTLTSIILILAFILLCALLIIVYIVQFNKGALRASTYDPSPT